MSRVSDTIDHGERTPGLERLRAVISGVLAHSTTILATLPCDAASSDDAIMRIALAVYRDQAERSRAQENDRRTLAMRRYHLRELAGALANARALLNETADSPELSADLGWKYESPADIRPRLYNDATKTMAEIEAMAVAAAERMTVKPGAPSDNRTVRVSLVKSLADIYQDTAGMKAGQPSNLDANGGPFFRFVTQVLSAVGGYDAKPETLRDTIRDALSNGARAARKAERRRHKIARVH
jgi:hypothetical protein